MLRLLARIFGGKTKPVSRPATPRFRFQARLGVEELTPRVLPSASSFGHFFSHQAHSLFSESSTAGSSTTGASTADSSQSSSTGDGCHGSEATFAASLTNATGATGKASYNPTTQTLNVHVTGAAASSTLDVAVDGANVGTLTTNASGNGHASFTGVTVNSGSTITVGDLTGTFAQIQFTSTLTGATGVTGTAEYNSVRNKLHLSVTGAAANTTYNVTVNDIVVGQFTTNASGTGRFKVTPSGVTVASGSTVSVSDTAGDAAILTGTFA
jgi:hypothetical protein